MIMLNYMKLLVVLHHFLIDKNGNFDIAQLNVFLILRTLVNFKIITIITLSFESWELLSLVMCESSFSVSLLCLQQYIFSVHIQFL